MLQTDMNECIRQLCAKVASAKADEVESVFRELWTALHEHEELAITMALEAMEYLSKK